MVPPASGLESEAHGTGTLSPSAVTDAIAQYLLDNVTGDILSEELAANPVPCENPEQAVAVSIDDVGVKKQKPGRKADGAKSSGNQKKKAWTTVAHIQHAGPSYALTAPSVPAVLRLLSARLVASGLRTQGFDHRQEGPYPSAAPSALARTH